METRSLREAMKISRVKEIREMQLQIKECQSEGSYHDAEEGEEILP